MIHERSLPRPRREDESWRLGSGGPHSWRLEPPRGRESWRLG
jgi:hypothetical protein